MPFRDDLRAPPVVLRQARWKMALVLAGSVGFTAVGVAFVRSPEAFATRLHTPGEALIVGWACLLFFSACALAALASLWRPVTLILDASGLQVRAPLRSYRRAWAEVSGFRLVQLRRSRFVVYDVEALAGRPPSMNRSLTGADAALPKGLTISPERLLEQVLEAQRRWS